MIFEFVLLLVGATALRIMRSRNLDELGQDRLRIPFHVLLAIALLVGCGMTACRKKHHAVASLPQAPHRSDSRKAHEASPAPAVPIGHTEQGIASWYGVPYHGRPAADGEIYDMETLVAAHRLLPFNTWIRVTNLINNKTVTVRVIDRGPFVQNRILDLLKAAARQIELLGPGIGPVRLEVVAAPPDIPRNDTYAVQVGAFTVRANAEHVRADYEQRFGASYIAVKAGRVPLYRVLVGKQLSFDAAQKMASTLSTTDKPLFVVRLDETVLNEPTAQLGTTVPASAIPAQSSEPLPPASQQQPQSR